MSKKPHLYKFTPYYNYYILTVPVIHAEKIIVSKHFVQSFTPLHYAMEAKHLQFFVVPIK